MEKKLRRYKWIISEYNKAIIWKQTGKLSHFELISHKNQFVKNYRPLKLVEKTFILAQ